MSKLTFNFCGVDAVTDMDLIVNNIRTSVTPELSENVQDVPGMVGKIFLGNTYGQKLFQIDITIKAENATELASKLHDLSDLVMTFGSGEYPMVFSNDSVYTYYGHFNSISAPEQIIPTSSWSTCSLVFACSDPKGYGEYITNDMTANPITITPSGGSDCYPIFTCMPKKDVTKIAITDEDGNYVYIGADIDPDTGDSPIDNEPLILHDPCNTLAPWTKITSSNLTFALDNGVIGGSMKATPSEFRVGTVNNKDDFGSIVNGKWHGPCELQWLPSSYSDYRIKVALYNRQYYPRSQGKCELYLLDSNGIKIGYISVKDRGNSEEVMIRIVMYKGSSQKILYNSYGWQKNGKTKFKTIKLGDGTRKVKEKGKTKVVQKWRTVKLEEDTSTSKYTDFYGYITLQKIGNKFTYEIMKLDDDSNPAWKKPVGNTITDNDNIFNQQLAGVAYYVAKVDIDEDKAVPPTTYTNNKMALCDLKVWNIINGGNGASSVPVTIARAGDEIKINCEDRTIYKNGEFFMRYLAIGSDFPTMQGGIDKTFAFEPKLSDADWYYEYSPTIL